MEQQFRNCTTCEKSFELTKANFYSNGYDKKGNQKLKSKCKKCFDDHAKNRLTDIITEHYGEYKCSVCGYDRCIGAIEFHHFNAGEKDFEVSKMSSFSKEKIISELEKCLMLCANCHREIHAGVLSKEEACTKIVIDGSQDASSTLAASTILPPCVVRNLLSLSSAIIVGVLRRTVSPLLKNGDKGA